jgi:hypothetical protein
LKKKFLILLVLGLPLIVYAATGTWTYQTGSWYNSTSGQTYYASNPATLPPGTAIPTGTPTSTPTIVATAGYIPETDGHGNFYSTVEAAGTGGVTAGLITSQAIQEINYGTYATYFLAPHGFGLCIDAPAGNKEIWEDNNDIRFRTLGAIFFGAQGSGSVETFPYLYEFETNNGDFFYKDFTIFPSYISTQWPLYAYAGVNSGGSTVGASAFAIQAAPNPTLTPGAATPVIVSSKPYTQVVDPGIAATPVTNVYLGGVLQSVNATPIQ